MFVKPIAQEGVVYILSANPWLIVFQRRTPWRLCTTLYPLYLNTTAIVEIAHVSGGQ